MAVAQSRLCSCHCIEGAASAASHEHDEVVMCIREANQMDDPLPIGVVAVRLLPPSLVMLTGWLSAFQA